MDIKHNTHFRRLVHLEGHDQFGLLDELPVHDRPDRSGVFDQGIINLNTRLSESVAVQLARTDVDVGDQSLLINLGKSLSLRQGCPYLDRCFPENRTDHEEDQQHENDVREGRSRDFLLRLSFLLKVT